MGSPHPTNFVVYPHSATALYKKDDICSGVASYYYATQDNTNSYHTASWTATGNAWQRTDGVMRITLAAPMSPTLARGSWVSVTGVGIGGFTGTLTDGGTTFLQFPDPGPDTTNTVAASLVWSSLSPVWTTGFGWIPSYSTNLDISTSTIEAKFDGYSQRMRNSINSVAHTFNLQFDDRSDREVVAIANFIEDMGGVESFRINAGAALIGGNPRIRYIALNPKIAPRSRNINGLTATVAQVFDLQ